MSQSETVRVRDLSQLNATPVYYIIPAFTLRFGIQCVIPVHKSKQEEISLNTPWVMFNVKCTTVIYGGNLSVSLSTGKIYFRWIAQLVSLILIHWIEIFPVDSAIQGLVYVIPVYKSKQEEISLNTPRVMFNVKCTTVIYGGNLSGSSCSKGG